jgi:membrane-bound lytic murein transglycosylase D
MKRTYWLACVPLLLVGCAASSSAPAAKPQPAPSILVQPDRDALELQKALEEAQALIDARTSGVVKPVIVDADAMLSMQIPQHPSIDGALQYFSTTLQPKIQNSLRRSAAHKAMVDQVLDEFKLPRALAYLPIIESAYVPTLTSSAGAHGLWQFMPATGLEYGLDIDWWIDERAHTEKSTRAAARYLRDLYRMFGDWSLALAAYNAGPGRVRRALADSNSATFWDLYEKSAIPRETRGYVPTFYATVIIASDPGAYGFELLENQSTDAKRVSVDGPVSLDYIAEVTGAQLEDLRRLNPELKRGVVPPRSSTIRVPSDFAQAVFDRASSMRYEDPYMAVASFTLRPGDTLTRISKAIGVPVDEISKMNGLRSPKVAVGRSIFLPVRQTELSARLEAVHSAPADRYYIIKQGDTLYSIARRNGLTVEELVDLNRLPADHVIQPGARLRVSMGSAVTAGGM